VLPGASPPPHFVIVEIKSDYYRVTDWPQRTTASDKKQETQIFIVLNPLRGSAEPFRKFDTV